MKKNMTRPLSFQPLSRDHGTGLLCALLAHKAVRASKHNRLLLAEEIRVLSRGVLSSYLEDEQRVLAPIISEFFLRAQFQWYYESLRRLMSELVHADRDLDPGLGLMASLAAALETYVRWVENSLFPFLEQRLSYEATESLALITAELESTRSRPTQVRHRSVTLTSPACLPTLLIAS